MALSDALALVDVEPREWGATVDYDRGHYRDTTQAFVHYGGNPVSSACASGDVASEKATLRAYERYHTRSGWWGIAYDFAIGNSGTIYGCRGDAKSGATAGDIDLDGIPNNREAEAVVLLLGKGQKPTSAALASLARLLDALDYAEVYGHRESAERGKGTATPCPGSYAMEFVRNYRAGNLSDYGGSRMFVRKGDKGPQVRFWQRVLHRIKPGVLGEYGADSVYGSDTAAAVAELAHPNKTSGEEINADLAEHFLAKHALKLAQRAAGEAQPNEGGEVPPHTHSATVELG